MEKKPSELSKINLSVALATFNEEMALGACLESIKGLADEIVVVDGSSTDKTAEIAKSFGAKVLLTDNKPVFHINKQLAIDECRGDWILLLDADEIVPPELLKEIKSLVADHPPAGEAGQSPTTNVAFWIKRRKMFLGRWIKKGGQYPDPVVRLFKKGKAKLPCKTVHEQMEVDGSLGWLNNPIVHLPTPSFSVYITKDNRYSTLTALRMKERKLKINAITTMIYIIVVPLKTFLSQYFWHKGFMDGFPGFVFAWYSGLHWASAFIKYWEMSLGTERDIDKDWV